VSCIERYTRTREVTRPGINTRRKNKLIDATSNATPTLRFIRPSRAKLEKRKREKEKEAISSASKHAALSMIEINKPHPRSV